MKDCTYCHDAKKIKNQNAMMAIFNEHLVAINLNKNLKSGERMIRVEINYCPFCGRKFQKEWKYEYLKSKE